MKTIIASVAAVIATAYAKEKVQRIALKQSWQDEDLQKAIEVCGPEVTKDEQSYYDDCWFNDIWTDSCYEIEARDECHSDRSRWEDYTLPSAFDDLEDALDDAGTDDDTWGDDWGSDDDGFSDWSSGFDYEYETCEPDWKQDDLLSDLDNCIANDFMYSAMCEAEWYAKYGYDTLDIEVCTGLERSFDAGCEYFMNWAILDSCGAYTYVESTCEGEDCGIPRVVKIILWSFVILLVAGVVAGIISATGSSSLPLLDSELTSLFMENSFADKITFDF